MGRKLLAVIAGTVAMFVWSFVAHEVLPLGEAGLHMGFPNDQAVVGATQSSLGNNSGIYFFPGVGLGPNPTRAQIRAAMPAYEQKLATSASGMVVYHAPGAAPVVGSKTLATEFLIEFLEVLLVVLLVTNAGVVSFGARMRCFILAGLLASTMTNFQYWNWYGFPTNYTLAQLATWIIGFIVAGIVASAVLGKGNARAAAA
jgi:hypothetical protein